MVRTVTKVRYSMTIRQLQKALEEIGLSTQLVPSFGTNVEYIEVWK